MSDYELLSWGKLIELWDSKSTCAQTVLTAVSKCLTDQGITECTLRKHFYGSGGVHPCPVSERVLSSLLFNILQKRPYGVDCALAQCAPFRRPALCALWKRLRVLYKGHHWDLCWHLNHTSRDALVLSDISIQEYRGVRSAFKLPSPPSRKESIVPSIQLRYLSSTCKPRDDTPSQPKAVYCKILSKQGNFKSPRYETFCERLLLLSQMTEGSALLKHNPTQIWIFQTIIL